MKVRDCSYDQETLQSTITRPLIRDNFVNILDDFEFLYRGFLDQDLPLQESQISQLKSDLLVAFCNGVQIGMDINSCFRIKFVTPLEYQEKPKSSIITNDNQIIGAPKKLIV